MKLGIPVHAVALQLQVICVLQAIPDRGAGGAKRSTTARFGELEKGTDYIAADERSANRFLAQITPS